MSTFESPMAAPRTKCQGHHDDDHRSPPRTPSFPCVPHSDSLTEDQANDGNNTKPLVWATFRAPLPILSPRTNDFETNENGSIAIQESHAQRPFVEVGFSDRIL